MARTKEMYETLPEVKEENKEKLIELMEVEGFDDDKLDSILPKLTSGQRKFLFKHYGGNREELRKQAERTLYYYDRASWQLLTPNEKRNYKKYYGKRN